MTKSRVFFILSLSFLGGVCLASFIHIEKSFLLILLATAIAISILNLKNKKALVIAGAVIFFTLGVWRTNISLSNVRDNLANEKLGPAEFTAIVTKEPETDEKSQKIIIKSKNESFSSYPVNWRKDVGKILINAPIFPEYQYGDELKVSCTLKKSENFSEIFDYQMYLAKDGIYRICDKPQITLVSKNRGSKIYSAILAIKNKFEKKLSAIFPDPEGAYLKGLLLGGSKRMTADLSEAFQKTGTTHTVAVSGYNVTIVAAFLMWLGIYLGLWRQQVFSFALAGIVLFVLAAGAPSSAVRAGIMGSLVIWAMKEGRLANSRNAILLAGSLMLLVNPLLLRYDAGFQLSFLATLGIVEFSPIFEKFWRPARIATLISLIGSRLWGKNSEEIITQLKLQSVAGGGRPPKIIQETVILTMSAMIFVLPVILNSFEKLSLVSPIANFLILPAIPAIMGTGFAAGIAGIVFLPLGKLVGFVPYILLKIELAVVQWLANLPWASIEIKNFGWRHILFYYSILALLLFYLKRKPKKIIIKQNES